MIPFPEATAATKSGTAKTTGKDAWRRRSALGACVLLLPCAALACGGATQASPDSGAPAPAIGLDGGTTETDAVAAPDTAAPIDAGSDANGAPSTTYPAFAVDVAQVVDNGGPVLTAPAIVTVTWSVDPDVATWNAFDDAIGPSAYWKSINHEYGVGPSSSTAANHVSITAAPPTEYADSDLDALVAAHAGVDWPAPSTNTLYALYLPPGTDLYLGGPPAMGGEDACQLGVGGYHVETQDANHTVYAIMPHCSYFEDGDIELSASHELNEASTDPHPYTNPAYVGFDQNHLAFEFFNQFQDELGDACEMFAEATDTTDFTPYVTQRQWSNKSAKAGSHWCLPALDEPFYNTTFLPQTKLDTIKTNLTSLGMGAGITTSKGFKIPVGQSVTFPIGLFSDRATGDFTLDVQGLDQPIAQDQSGNAIDNGTATVTLDLKKGQNGQIANVTVTPKTYSSLGLTYFYIRAVLPNSIQHHYLPILLSKN